MNDAFPSLNKNVVLNRHPFKTVVFQIAFYISIYKHAVLMARFV